MSDYKTPRHPVPVTISEYQIAGLLCSAREGGSNYWAYFTACPYTYDSRTLLPFKLPVQILDVEDEEKPYTLAWKEIQRGISLLHTVPHHLASILKDNADAETGDVFLQLCIFGKLVYG